MNKGYPTDMTDEHWAVIEPLLPPAKRGGRPRRVTLRLVLNTIFYLNKAGCQWALLPSDLAKRSTANGYFSGKKVNGRKRHLVVDSLGLLLVVLVTAANADDGTTAPEVLKQLTAEHQPRLDEIR